MAAHCYYCQAQGDFELFQNPEEKLPRSTCEKCRSEIISAYRKLQFAAKVRFFGIPLLTFCAIIVILFWNWQTGIVYSIIAALIAGLEMLIA